jgi:large subunit ribosomal protein L22
MEIKASVKHLRMSPRKVRLVVDVIRKMPIEQALEQLRFLNKKATEPVAKLLKTAVADAEHNFNLDRKNLMIKEIKVDEGLTLKRWMPRAHGRATKIRKRACHINLVLAEIVVSGKKETRKVKAEDPVKLEQIVAEAEKANKGKGVNKKTEAAIADKEAKPSSKVPGKGFASKMFQRKSG